MQLRSNDCRILIVNVGVEVSKGFFLGDLASEVVEHILRKLLGEELVILSLVLELDVLSKLNEDSSIVLAAEECVTIVRIFSELLVYIGVVGELVLVLNKLGADAASSHVPPQK